MADFWTRMTEAEMQDQLRRYKQRDDAWVLNKIRNIVNNGGKIEDVRSALRGTSCPYYPGCEPDRCTRCWEHDAR